MNEYTIFNKIDGSDKVICISIDDILEFLKKAQGTSLGFGIGEFESMHDWNLIIVKWLGETIKKLEKLKS